MNIIRKVFNRIFPIIGIQLIYFKNYRRFANLRKPEKLYEKLLWMNFYDRDIRKTNLTDKYLVREHLKNLGLGNHLNELYGVFDSPDEIDFHNIPSPYILKCNHGAKYNIVCKNPDDNEKANTKNQLSKWLKQDYSLYYSEMHYRNIKRKIICEKYLGDNINDYKVYCFNGKPEIVMLCTDRGKSSTLFFCYTFDWQYVDLLTNHHPDPGFKRPEQLDELYNFCEKLAEDWPFVRVDTYICNGEIIFGEMTFTPGGFIDNETLPEVDLKLGQMIKLPINKS